MGSPHLGPLFYCCGNPLKISKAITLHHFISLVRTCHLVTLMCIFLVKDK